MAGPWLKMECATPEKPEVLAITAALGWDDPDLTVGKLFRLWRWFDQHTTDGNAPRVTSSLLDRVLGVTGFVQAVADAGWLTVNGDGISLSNFDRHNGDTAKNRALTAKRVAEHKANAKGNDEGNAQGNGVSVTESVPRGRGRGRGRSNTPPNGGESAKPRATRQCPESFTVTDDMKAWAQAECSGVDLMRETAKFRDHTFKVSHSDWVGAWRNWMRKAGEFARPAHASPSKPPTAAQMAMAQACPSLVAPHLQQYAPQQPTFTEVINADARLLD